MISLKFPGRTENDVKNRFYTTLKRVATRAQLEDPVRYSPSFIKCKNNLIQFVDAAIMYGQLLPSKRGRKKNSEKKLAGKQSILFPSTPPPRIFPSQLSDFSGNQNSCPPTAPPFPERYYRPNTFFWPAPFSQIANPFSEALSNMDNKDSQLDAGPKLKLENIGTPGSNMFQFSKYF